MPVTVTRGVRVAYGVPQLTPGTQVEGGIHHGVQVGVGVQIGQGVRVACGVGHVGRGLGVVSSPSPAANDRVAPKARARQAAANKPNPTQRMVTIL